ncbi:MAG: rhomboid family intramembrane serine protease [Cyclobacteriaceae bacterium]|nr:rhomboid family intramembrane serine protease [Cyclobacteriaceae bacterium]
MFSSIKSDLHSQWSRPNGGLQRLIIINVAVFLIVNLAHLFISSEETYLYFIKFFAMPTDYATFITRPWTFVTSFFTHMGFSHIFWNMVFLYWFGIIIREYLGSDRLINLYILGGLMGSAFIFILFYTVPSVNYEIALGASAGVYAVMIGAATLLPNYTFHLLFIGPVKIKYIAAFHIVMAILGLKGTNYGGELAHLGGAFIGYFYIRSLQKGTDLGAWIGSTMVFIKSFFVKQSKMKVNYSRKQSTKTYSSGTPKTEKKKHSAPTQAEIDRILDKISQSGYESLSKEEKEKLFNASKK